MTVPPPVANALAAAILNDYWGIAVRNACFCAHPYVREMLKPELWEIDTEVDVETPEGLAALERRHGMVRASPGLYTTQEDLDILKEAIATMLRSPEQFKSAYVLHPDGSYTHRTAHRDAIALFDPARELSKHIAAATRSTDRR